MSNKEPYSKAGLLVLILALVAFAGLGIYFVSADDLGGAPAVSPVITASELPNDTVAPAAGDAVQPVDEETPVVAETPAGEPEAVAEEAPAPEATATENAEINVDAAKSVRAIGDASAPVKIVEYSSLTCPHCAHFHKDTLKALKEQYIDTGKVYFEFVEFPLNEPALKASLLARCLPADRYYAYVQMLFENQDKWAFEQDYLKYIKQNAQLAGLSSEQADACLNNEDLQKFIATRMEDVQNTKQINSTPTFVINDKDTISGAQKLEAFSKVIDPLLEGKKE